jgi:hypothetical protein
MSTSQRLALDPNVELLDFEAFARALGFYPTMTSLQASFLGGYADASFLDLWDEAHDVPRPAYFGMNEDGLVLRVIAGQVGMDAWGAMTGLRRGPAGFRCRGRLMKPSTACCSLMTTGKSLTGKRYERNIGWNT